MRSIKQDLDLLMEIKNVVCERLNVDFTQPSEIEYAERLVTLIFENQNKWLLSDKISSEKQLRMDQYKSEKNGMGTPGGEEGPTPKQISYATELGIDVEKRVYTKASLSKAIDEKLKKGGK